MVIVKRLFIAIFLFSFNSSAVEPFNLYGIKLNSPFTDYFPNSELDDKRPVSYTYDDYYEIRKKQLAEGISVFNRYIVIIDSDNLIQGVLGSANIDDDYDSCISTQKKIVKDFNKRYGLLFRGYEKDFTKVGRNRLSYKYAARDDDNNKLTITCSKVIKGKITNKTNKISLSYGSKAFTDSVKAYHESNRKKK